MNKVESILEECGGATRIAYHLGMNQYSIERWCGRGIPERHWKSLIKLNKNGLTPKKLHEANEDVRRVMLRP